MKPIPELLRRFECVLDVLVQTKLQNRLVDLGTIEVRYNGRVYMNITFIFRLFQDSANLRNRWLVII